jgi:hypothetical protein
MVMTYACRMQVYEAKELGQDIMYLSPMHITQRVIIGHDVPDTHPRPVNLDRLDRVLARVKMQGEIKFIKGQYVL